MAASASARSVVAARRSQVLRLRAAGFTYQQIADQLQMRSRAAVATDLMRALESQAQVLRAEAKYYVPLELERLDQMERVVHQVVSRATVALANQAAGLPNAAEGLGLAADVLLLQATDRLLRIAERRAALLGLDGAGRGLEQPSDPLDELAERRRRKLAMRP